MAMRLDQDGRKMMAVENLPPTGFRAQQAQDQLARATAYLAQSNDQMRQTANALAAGTPIGVPVSKMVELAGHTIWSLVHALLSLGVSAEAVLQILRERVVSGQVFDLAYLVHAQLIGSIGPATAEEMLGSVLPIAGEETPSYAVDPEAHPEAPTPEMPP